jgi:hypothetical protein
MSVFFGLAAALVPGSLEQRMGSFLFFGLIPAAAFHVGAIVFGGILAFSSELCEVIAVSSFRWLARLVKKYLILASMSLVPISEVFDAARAHCRINDVNFKRQRLLLTPSWLSAC